MVTKTITLHGYTDKAKVTPITHLRRLKYVKRHRDVMKLLTMS